MTLDELIKLARKNPKVKDALVVMTKALEKRANSKTHFDETVPIRTEVMNENVSGSGISGTAMMPNQSVPQMVDQAAPGASQLEQAYVPQEQIAAYPSEETVPPQTLDPSEEAARAAQIFLAPILQLALSGDENAQKIIAMASGEVARSASETAVNALFAINTMNQAPQEQQALGQDTASNNVNPLQPAVYEESQKDVPKTSDEKRKGAQTDESMKYETQKVSSDKKIAAAMIILANAMKP